MPLQNRVTPYGKIEFSSERGTFMGNRGILHGKEQNLLTQKWHHKNWIICELDYKDVQRELMKPNQYTELFFLDEAVALSAGHRPCGLCRKLAFGEFVTLWSRATGELAKANLMDDHLHLERTGKFKGKPLLEAVFGDLPYGTFVEDPERPGEAFLKFDQAAYEFSQAGYGQGERWPKTKAVKLITPAITVEILRRGYVPTYHPSLPRR